MREALLDAVREIGRVIVGKEAVIEKILIALLAEGHVLLDDVPGVGKTTLAVAISKTLGLTSQRVQCTPDLLPSDIIGFSIYDRESGGFVYRQGALGGIHLLLADELNRASSKTQSALLEAMEERQVTVDGVTHPLERPFAVIATQNSVGAVGTQPLPYAQMDRFAVRLTIGYPDYEAQMTLLRDRQTDDPLQHTANVMTREDFCGMQRQARQVTVKDSILDYITRLTMASREHEAVRTGISPRGALYLNRIAKAHAFADGRDYVTGADVQTVFADVCTHRLVLRDEGADPVQVLDGLLRKVGNPDRGVRR